METLNLARRIEVNDRWHVGETRRTAAELAVKLGFSEEATGRVSIIATELATNLVKHTRGGEIIARTFHDGAVTGVEIIAIDKGPGIADVVESMRDGYSTKGSPGTGLGAISRLSGSFHIYSQPGRGTVMVARCTGKPVRPGSRPARMEVDGFSLPKPNETVSGDNWAVSYTPSGCRILVVDGLGHGPLAAEASTLAVSSFLSLGERPLLERFEEIHQALRVSRGAAASIAEIDLDDREVCYLGVGNIAAFISSREKVQQLVSMNGIVGHQARSLREFTYPWPVDAVLVLTSDGLSTRWDSSADVGLMSRPASIIAGVLYRDLSRGRDDATVVVARERRAK